MITQPLRILFITNNYLPYTGGVVHSIMTSAQALRALGHEVYIVTLDFGETESDPWVIRLKCPLQFTYKKNAMAVPWRVSEQLQHHITLLKPDILHTHHPFLLGNIVRRVAQKYAIPIVFTYHTLYEEYVHYIPLPRILTRPLVRSLAHRYCSKVEGIIAPSFAIQDYLGKHGVTQPITVIPSAIRTCFLHENIPDKKRNNNEPFRLLTVSRFVPEKNLEALLHVCSMLGDKFNLILAGYGYLYERLQQYAYQTLLLSEEQVQFIHKPDIQTLVELYKQADLFLFASRTDTQGLVLAEAMAAGTPVIAFDGPGQRSIIQQGVNGFIVEHAEHMRDSIMFIKQNKDLYGCLCYNAFKTAQLYTPHSMAEKLVALYGATIF